MAAWQKSEGMITAISYSDPTWLTGVQSEHELHKIALKMFSMWQRGNMMWQDFLILKVRILQLLYRLEWVSKIFIYSLSLGELFLPVGVQALQRAFHLSWSQATVLTSFHSIPSSFKFLYIHSSQVFHLCLFPCVLAFQPIMGSVLFLILNVPFTFNCHFKRGLAWKFLYKCTYNWQFIQRPNCMWWWVCLSGHSLSLPFTLIRWTTQFPWYSFYNIYKIICWIKCF
jgi:hypothetical protein